MDERGSNLVIGDTDPGHAIVDKVCGESVAANVEIDCPEGMDNYEVELQSVAATVQADKCENVEESDTDEFQYPQSPGQKPEEYLVEGEPRIESNTQSKEKHNSSRNKLVSEKRNCGEEYYTEKSNKYVSGRKFKPIVKRCSGYCKIRELSCPEFSHEEMLCIRQAYFTGSLQSQREWIARHILAVTPHTSTRRHKTIKYYLPKGEDNVKHLVCKKMFLNTMGISERQIRTVVTKLKLGGTLDEEKRGGRQTKFKHQALRDEVQKHIERFPKMIQAISICHTILMSTKCMICTSTKIQVQGLQRPCIERC